MAFHLLEFLIAAGAGVVIALVATLVGAIDRLESLAPPPELPEEGGEELVQGEHAAWPDMFVRRPESGSPQSPGG